MISLKCFLYKILCIPIIIDDPDTSQSQSSADIPLEPISQVAHQQASRIYPDYIQANATNTLLDGVMATISRLRGLAYLVLNLASPWNRIMDIMSEMINSIREMRDNVEECAHLAHRIVTFLETLMDSGSIDLGDISMNRGLDRLVKCVFSFVFVYKYLTVSGLVH
jgi:hypothetical protein